VTPSNRNLPATEILAETINDGFLLIDPDWKIIYSNHKAQQLLQLSSVELSTRSLWDLIAVDSNATVQREFDRAIQQQVPVEVDVFYPGLFTWHEVRAAPSPQGLILIMRDITDRQWLVHSEAERTFLRNLFIDAPVAMAVTRGFQHELEFVNNQGKKLIGGREVEGLTMREAFPELADQGILEILDHVYQTGEPYQIENRMVQFDRNGNGVLEEVHFNISYQALRGFNGTISGILNISLEV